MTNIQDETHRYANDYRKRMMHKKSYAATLTELPGVGPKKMCIRDRLEADVNYKVAKDCCAQVSERAMGQEVMESLTPAQQVVKIDADKAKQWLANGAQATDTVRVLLKKENIL